MKREMGEVKVIGAWFSPYVKRVEIALKLKGVDYEYIEIDVINTSPLILQHNPIHKKVPVLLHDDKSVVESVVILEYIDEVWGGPSILPKDPYRRAMARFWAKFIDEKCLPATKKTIWAKGDEREKAVEEATNALKILENELKGKKFFGGDQIGYVDIVGSVIAYWFPIFDEVIGPHFFTQAKFPNLCKWADELCDNKFIKENLPDKERLVARLRGNK